jgi:hypothetical protein
MFRRKIETDHREIPLDVFRKTCVEGLPSLAIRDRPTVRGLKPIPARIALVRFCGSIVAHEVHDIARTNGCERLAAKVRDESREGWSSRLRPSLVRAVRKLCRDARHG